MPYTLTTSTKKLSRLRTRIRAVSGGTSAGKTVSILQLLIDDAQTDTTPTLTSVVSESFPHLRRGAMRDFLNIMNEHGYYKEARWERGTFTYTFETGSRIEFFSADQPSKVRGPRRDRLFINEANNIPYEAFDQLEIRTRQYIWLDWNPTAEFYFYTDILDKRNDVGFLTTTYLDNEGLDPSIVSSIEAHKPNKAWWRVYGLGQLGEVEGLIFPGWKIIDEVPHEARLEVRGLDFGYARDPNALCDIYYYNGGYIIDELAYRTGMLNRQTADLILNQPDANVLTIADSAEVKSIAEMAEYGVNIMGVVKRGAFGETFTNSAIKYVQGHQMSLTKRSVNYIKSNRNFVWQVDKHTGKPIPHYDHYWSDGMMSVVYGMTATRPKEDEDVKPYMTGDIQSLFHYN